MDESGENLSNKAGIYFELRAYKKKMSLYWRVGLPILGRGRSERVSLS